MENANTNEKEQQPSSSTVSVMSSTSAKIKPVQASSSSPSVQPEITQEAKRLKPTDPDQTHESSSPRPPPMYSNPVESPFQAAAAQLRIKKPKERTEYKLALLGGDQLIPKRKKRRRRPGRVWIPPGPSPLGLDPPSPYQKVKRVLSVIRNYLNSGQLLSSTSPPLSDPNAAKPTLEKVIELLDEYVDGISRNATEEEMEGLLRVFQKSVNVDDEEISWYGLIEESSDAFWKTLSEHFICETFFDSDLEDDEDEEEDMQDGDDDDVPNGD